MKKKENSIEKKLKKGYKYYTLAILVGLVTIGGATNVLAADDPISVVNNLSNFIFS